MIALQACNKICEYMGPVCVLLLVYIEQKNGRNNLSKSIVNNRHPLKFTGVKRLRPFDLPYEIRENWPLNTVMFQ